MLTGNVDLRKVLIGDGGQTLLVVIGGDATADEEQAIRAAIAETKVVAQIERITEPLNLEATACNNMWCDPPLRAGERYTHTDFFCTLGFAVYSPIDSSDYMLTAGHCLRGNENVSKCGVSSYPHCEVFGYDYAGYFGDGDAGLIRVTNPAFPSYPAWWNYPGNDSLPVTGSQASQIGQYVCHTGQDSSGTMTTCGTVVMLNSFVVYGDGTQLNRMTIVKGACNIGGNSGGPWIDPNSGKATGIHSGGKVGCPSDYSVYQEVDRALADLGVLLKTL